jgi:hypothetical protein
MRPIAAKSDLGGIVTEARDGRSKADSESIDLRIPDRC